MKSTDILSARRPVRRVRDLSLAQWSLLVEASLTLAAASLAIAVLPFQRVVRLATWKPAHPNSSGPTPVDIDEAAWAIEAIAWRVPWRTVCFQKGLALHLILRRGGVPSTLHYGVGMDTNGALKAHVWVSVAGHIVQGGNVVDRFHCLATYPDDPINR